MELFGLLVSDLCGWTMLITSDNSKDKIKQWRLDRYQRGQSCGILDYWECHGICFQCKGQGKCSLCQDTGKWGKRHEQLVLGSLS